MPSVPDPLQHAAAAFDSLPGVGPRAALRYAYWLVTQPKEAIQRFAATINALASSTSLCEACHQISDRSPCRICVDPSRDQQLLCIVATSQDVRAIEDTGVFHGRYHVLGGTLDPIEGRTPERLTIQHLLQRLQPPNAIIKEVILALDTDIPGDTTSLYLRKQLTNPNIRLSRLARGLPNGAALEYADANTLADALTNRKDANGNSMV